MSPFKLKTGVLDELSRVHALTTDEQLAAALGVPTHRISRLRAGGVVGPQLALRIAAIRGDQFDLSGTVERYHAPRAAA